MRARLPILAALLLVAGCARDTGGDWPSLAPRPGESAPMVPRPALGCAGCTDDDAAPPVTPAPPPAAPAD
ncbi:hypothetical protein IP88_07450, partial [alpha proteobacterium AAP81b]